MSESACRTSQGSDDHSFGAGRDGPTQHQPHIPPKPIIEAQRVHKADTRLLVHERQKFLHFNCFPPGLGHGRHRRSDGLGRNHQSKTKFKGAWDILSPLYPTKAVKQHQTKTGHVTCINTDGFGKTNSHPASSYSS